MSIGRRFIASLLTALLSVLPLGCSPARDAGKLGELQRARSGTLVIVLLSPGDALRHGKDTFAIEFRSTSGGSLVDVGTVKGSATMPMGGTPMLGSVEVRRTDVPGRYEVNSDLSMAGTWRTTIEWNGPEGQGSVTFSVPVQ